MNVLVASLLFRFGAVTSYVSLFAPLPSFMICGKDCFAQRAQLSSIQFNFLLMLFVIGDTWLVYFASLTPVITTFVAFNQARVAMSCVYLAIYCHVCVRAEQLHTHLGKGVLALLAVLMCRLTLKTTHSKMVAAMSFEMASNLLQLGAVPQILKTKALASINVPIATCCMLDATTWFLYSIVEGDPLFFALNGAGILQGLVNFYLYQWVCNRRADDDWLIMCLRRSFKIFSIQNVDKVQKFDIDPPL